MDNPYGKLNEALRVYLNPSLELINKNEDLSKHCYYIISKLPPTKSEFWNKLETRDYALILQWLEDIKGNKKEKITDKKKLVSNLTLAMEKDDNSYLDFLIGLKPKNKLSIGLIRKKAIVDEKFAIPFEIDEIQTVSTIDLKMHIHKYIAKHELQEDSNVHLDDNLKNILKIDEKKKGKFDNEGKVENVEKIHYFDLLKYFNKAYVQRFSEEDSSSS